MMDFLIFSDDAPIYVTQSPLWPFQAHYQGPKASSNHLIASLQAFNLMIESLERLPQLKDVYVSIIDKLWREDEDGVISHKLLRKDREVIPDQQGACCETETIIESCMWMLSRLTGLDRLQLDWTGSQNDSYIRWKWWDKFHVSWLWYNRYSSLAARALTLILLLIWPVSWHARS